MFDIAWTELLVIAVVTIIVVGPKELPRLLRTLGQYTAKIRSMANDFKAQLDDAVKDTGLDALKSDIDAIKESNPVNDLRSALNPMDDDFEEDFKKLADDEDFDDPAAEDDGEESWELWNDSDGVKDKKNGDGTQIVEPDAPVGATDKDAAADPEEAAEDLAPASETANGTSNGARPHGQTPAAPAEDKHAEETGAQTAAETGADA